jgi:hypothetical protein
MKTNFSFINKFIKRDMPLMGEYFDSVLYDKINDFQPNSII